MNDQENLAQKIVNYREAQDMTQAELAKKSGIERTALNKIEKGTRKVSSDELKSIAVALNISSDTLLDMQVQNDDTALTWADLGMPYKGKIPEELKATYADIAKGYFKRHPEYLNKD